MDQDSVHMVAASKVSMLKPGEYELWRMRMEQYIQMIDYSLWEVIGNAPFRRRKPYTTKLTPISDTKPNVDVGIKRLLDDLRVTAAKLMLLVYKLLLLVFRVNAAGTKLQLLKSYNCLKIKTAERVSTVRREWIKTEERIKIDWRSRLLT
ncbi:hypothetical protein Tco_0406905 [Tanacetum coccineum]